MRFFGFLLYSFLKPWRTRFILPAFFDKYISMSRCFALRLQGARIGKETVIREKVFIVFPRNLIIGDKSKIGTNTQIYNYSLVSIGNNCELGPNLYVQTNEHVWKESNKPIREQGSVSKEVHIGNNVYSGYAVVVLNNGSVADDTVLGACTLVNKKLESGFIYAGVPAKKIKPLY